MEQYKYFIVFTAQKDEGIQVANGTFITDHLVKDTKDLDEYIRLVKKEGYTSPVITNFILLSSPDDYKELYNIQSALDAANGLLRACYKWLDVVKDDPRAVDTHMALENYVTNGL